MWFHKESFHCHSHRPVQYHILAPSQTEWKTCPLLLQKIHCLMIQCICFFTFPIAVMNNSPVTERYFLLVVDGGLVEFFHFIFLMKNWPLLQVWWGGQDEQIFQGSMASVYEKSLVCRELNRVDGNSCLRVDVSSFPLKSLLQPM